MPTPDTIDLTQLLAPVAGDNAAGVNLREDASPNSIYYKLKDARTEARDAERRAQTPAEENEPPPPDPRAKWKLIVDQAPGVVATKSKDLEFAVWLTEALIRIHGFAGLRDGLRLIAGLVTGYWAAIHPQPEEGAEEDARLEILNSVVPSLVEAVQRIPFAATPEGEKLAFWQYPRARGNKAASVEEMERFDQAIRAVAPAKLQEILEDSGGCVEAIAQLGAAFDTAEVKDAPGLGGARDVIQEIQTLIRDRAKAILPAVPGGEAAGEAGASPDGGAAPAAAGSAASAGVPGGRVATREDAFRQLAEIAGYFRRTEPHSPISYTLEELVRRGRLPLQALLEELITDETARRSFLVSAGIKPP